MSIFDDAGSQWNIDPLLLQALERVESSGNVNATSSAGAQGNMQFMPGTAGAVGVANPRYPSFSVPGAAKLLDSLLRGPAKGDLTTALRMYNGGEDRRKWGPQNAAYAQKVSNAYQTLLASQGPSQATANFNPATASLDDLDARLGGGGGASVTPSHDIGSMSTQDLDKALSAPVKEEAPTQPPVTGVAPVAAAKPSAAPAAPQETSGAMDEYGRPVPSLGPISSDEKANVIRNAGNVLNAVTHGLSFGLDRPLESALSYLPGFGGSAELAQANRQQFQQEHPVLNAAAEAVGSVPTYATGEGALARVLPSVAGGGLLAGAGNLLRSGIRNALTSAGMSFGESEGDLADRAKAAETGAIVGAATPPVTSAIGSVLGKAVAPIMARIGGNAAENQAVAQVGKALARDQITPADLASNLQRLGPNGALVDAGGANLRNLGETVANTPGEASQAAQGFLEGRAQGQQSRVNDAITAATGSTGDFHAALGDLAQQRAANAAPKYEAAFNRIKVTPDEASNVQRFIHDNIGQDALQKGMRVIELEKLAAGQPFNPADYGVAKGDDGRFVLNGDTPNLRLFDAVKRGYDDIVEGFRDPTTGKLNLNQYGRAVNDVRASYVNELRDMFPRYGSALDAWAGPSKAMDALSMGRRALSNDPEVSAKIISGLSDTDKQFFMTGLARALKDKVEGVQDGADATRRIFGNQLIRDKIKAALGDDAAFDQFQNTMEQEAAFAKTRNDVLKGSPTARRLAGQQDMGFDVVTPAVHAATGNPLGAALHMGQQAWNALSAAPPRSMAPLGQMLFTPGGINQELMAALMRNRNPLMAPLLQRAATTGANRLETGGVP